MLSGDKLAAEFQRATKDVWEYRTMKEFQERKLQLYGLYKTATVGACTADRPPNLAGMKIHVDKWEAWMQASTFSKEEAMKRYVELAYQVIKACSERKLPSEAAAGVGPVSDEIRKLKERIEEQERTISAIQQERQREDELRGNDCEGLLTRWRERDAFMFGGSMWEPVYLTLRGTVLAVHAVSSNAGPPKPDANPSTSINLAGCVLRDEGTKPGRRRNVGPDGKPKSYHIFGLYRSNDDITRGPNAGVIMRLSCENEAEAQGWIAHLNQACSGLKAEEDDDSVGGAPATTDDGSVDTAPPPQQQQQQQHQQQPQQRLSVASPPPALPRRRSVGLLSPAGQQQPPLPPPVKRKFDATAFPASKPMHKQEQPSLLSESSTEQSYRGFANLGFIIVVVSNLRNVMSNFKKFGFLFGAHRLSFNSISEWPCFTGSMALSLHILAAWLIERLVLPSPTAPHKGMISGAMAMRLHGANMLLASVIPLWIVWHYTGTPIFGFGYLFTATILVLKLASYAHCNRDLRLAWLAAANAAKTKGDANATAGSSSSSHVNLQSAAAAAVAAAAAGGNGHADSNGQQQQAFDIPGAAKGSSPSYPANVTLFNAFWFWFAPTLSYQLQWPRSRSINIRYIATLLLRLVVGSVVQVVVVEQYIIPAVKASHGALLRSDWVIYTENLLALSVPNIYCWLLGFYLFFHVYLNLLAELTRFGDRIFYRAWWNSRDIEEYWRLWNIPVHFWMVRHMYFPLLRSGWSKAAAQTGCFVLSAVLHEVLISVPFRMLRVYAFLGMVGNIPLMSLTKAAQRLFGKESQAGNYLFWVAFTVLSQPAMLILYYKDYCAQPGKECSGPLDTKE